MLIDTTKTIAYKCSSCGSFEFYTISVFSLLHKKENNYSCRCKKSCMTIKREGESGFLIKTPCIGCGNEHIFFIGKKEMIFNQLNVFNCPETGMQQCFLGNDLLVRKKVDSLEEELDELMDMFGYDNYFKNTQVMLDSLNKIHDIAAQGSLFCQCGSGDIELVLLSDRILLKCSRCSSSKMVRAASNEDLKELMQMYGILITSDDFDYEKKKAEKYFT